MPPSATQTNQNKLDARQCLLAADKFIKELQFVEAKTQIEKARTLDPTNIYISAFIDRINYFEQQKKADQGNKNKTVHDTPSVTVQKQQHTDASPVVTPQIPIPSKSPAPNPQTPVQSVTEKRGTPSVAPPVQPPKVTPVPPRAAPVQPQKATPVPPRAAPPVQPPKATPVPPRAAAPAPPHVPTPALRPAPPDIPFEKGLEAVQTPPPNESVPEKFDTQHPTAISPEWISPPKSKLQEEELPQSPNPPIRNREQEYGIPIQVPSEEIEQPIMSPSIRGGGTEKGVTELQLDEMKRQIELLSKALDQEKKAREDMNRNQVQQAITQFRSKLEKAWVDGIPPESKLEELRQLAEALSISENVIGTIQREVKIEMYGRAVKEVISKRQLLRSSSSTLDWLRKVYQISMDEYLEYESKFLLDLVADQYKGTIIQISSDDKTKTEIMPKLKSLGYAVVTSPAPEDALEKIEKLNPNVILCETSFGPGSISGIRFLHILRTNSKYNFIPFVFLSSEEDYSLLTSSELRPNEGYVKKPVNFDELSSLINTKLLWFREYVMSLSK